MSAERFRLRPIGSPWSEFLRDIDGHLHERTEIHCIGGFAHQLLCENSRPTGDVDVVETIPAGAGDRLGRLAGPGSDLGLRHRLSLEWVRVVEPPAGYRERLLDATPADFENLRVRVLDPYDLVLTKIERNSPRDREDIRSLFAELDLDPAVLRSRFETELKPFLAVAPERTILTFDLWMEELGSRLPPGD